MGFNIDDWVEKQKELENEGKELRRRYNESLKKIDNRAKLILHWVDDEGAAVRAINLTLNEKLVQEMKDIAYEERISFRKLLNSMLIEALSREKRIKYKGISESIGRNENES